MMERKMPKGMSVMKEMKCSMGKEMPEMGKKMGNGGKYSNGKMKGKSKAKGY